MTETTTITESITIIDPTDGSIVGSIEAATPEDAARAVDAARAAQGSWQILPAAERGDHLRKAAAALEAHGGELARLNHRETGRPVEEAAAGIASGAATLRQYAETGPLHCGQSLRGQHLATDYTVPEPRGVAALLTPWNDPVAVAAGLIGAALVTGNTVLHKPSERCPHLGRRLGEILGAVFPEGVLTTLDGGPDVGALLTAHPGIDVVAHVGSSATGRRIAHAATATGAHCILENGGKDALLVDAGVDGSWAAAQAALGAFANSGQICTSVERIYVHRAVAEVFERELVARARHLNANGRVAPLVDRRLREVVAAQVDHAVAAGARLGEGGRVPSGPGAHYPATVLLECTAEMEVMMEETFGPVAPVMVVEDFAEGLAAAAAGRYGLAATVLTADMRHAREAVSGLAVGTVKINSVFGGAPGGSAQPRGASGRGFGYGPRLLDEFTHVKVVHMGLPGSAEPWTAK
ncbi:succinate-semialdehyde dehydrogenase [Zafaria cholistanensis]|uniref:Succinate-semialdehyde dehydrogenase n=1 Tax=Zafaria cholistanensis TaxID=1682741 RepID=A0A5A7NQH6_9MICC|nr:aldehyde dehydrogenase family protein [Zafaria cholistanensis]GER23113.1 succinate-semialdehyde dehydrogenase [Zafaria cholistanensis]